MARLSLSIGLIGFVGCAFALRLENPTVPLKANALGLMSNRDNGATCAPPAAYRQQLRNLADLQYFTEISLGGQNITGILDTGSFELVVFDSNCTTCGMAGVYNSTASPTFRGANVTKVHSYGSGSCHSTAGYDEVTLGCYRTPRQPLWLADDCRMPLLTQAGFQSIVGVGPPGQPEFTAKQMIKQLDEIEAKMRQDNKTVPPELGEARVEAQKELEDAADKKSLLESFGMTTFSTCLGRKPGSPAWMIWNDETRQNLTGVTRLPVVGNITWGIALEGISMEFTPSPDVDFKNVTEVTVGCVDGCGAIVDTGTSLLSVPTPTFRAIAGLIEDHMLMTDCTDLSSFPTFIITVAGHKLRLPPSSYIGTVSGQPSAEAAKYLPHLNHLGQEPSGAESAAGAAPQANCQLLLMDMGMEMTQFGPMAILGMPLFREYYTTFDLGTGRGNRSIFVSPADESCNPEVDDSKVNYNRNRYAFKPRHVDLSKVRVPQWLERHSSFQV